MIFSGGTYIIINIGRKWNDELEETITTLQQFLEEQCDAYFVDIKQRAVKVHNKIEPSELLLDITCEKMYQGSWGT